MPYSLNACLPIVTVTRPHGKYFPFLKQTAERIVEHVLTSLLPPFGMFGVHDMSSTQCDCQPTVPCFPHQIPGGRHEGGIAMGTPAFFASSFEHLPPSFLVT